MAEVLDAAGLDYIDLTDCVSRVRPEERFHRFHYTAVANAAVARCLEGPVREALGGHTAHTGQGS